MSRRGIGAILVGLLVAAGIGGCGKHPDVWGEQPGLRVMVSFPPLYCFAANVAGDKAVVKTMLDGTNVHEYHPTPHDSIKLHTANLFFVNGLGLDEGFAETLANNANNPKLKLVEIGEADLLKSRLLKMHAAEKGDAHGHKHGEYDPHLWLGLPEAIEMVKIIRDNLKEADPANAKTYDDNAKEYIDKLTKILEDGRKALKDKKEKKLVTFHDSLGYFARAFDLQIIGTIQPTAGEDAPPRRMADLVELCKKEKARVVVVEPGQSAETEANRLVEELQKKDMKDATKVEIDMMESVPRAALKKDYYEEKMKQNIEALAKTLK